MNSGGAQVQPSSDRQPMTMRERVARAICASDKTAPNPDAPILWRGVRAEAWEARQPMADAALTALEDPTPEMVEAGRQAINEKWGDFDALSDEEMIRVVWPAMIRAAKQEK